MAKAVHPYKSEGYLWIDNPKDTDDYQNGYVSEEQINENRANSLIAWCRDLEDEQRAVHEYNFRHFQFYSNRFLQSFDWGTNRYTQASLEPVTLTTDNVIIQVVDALLAEVGKARPKAKPVLFGASHKKHRQARKLDKFLYGEFIRTNLFEEAKSALLNAFICGFGVLRVEMDGNDRTCVKNIFPDDIIIDNTEYTNTGRLYTVAYRRVLPAKMVMATYGLTEEECNKACASSTSYLSWRRPGAGWIVVVEGIRAAYRDGDGKLVPGRRMTAIPGIVLEDEPYKEEWLPYCFYHWSRPNKTFYTQSVVEQAMPNQLRLIDINAVIHRCQEIVSRPRLLVQQGSKVSPLEINNLNAKILMYTGIKPEPLKWDAVAPELYNERGREIEICFDKFGLNQHTAGGGVPDGVRLDSSAALQMYSGIQNSRLSDPIQRYENLFLDVARCMIRTIKASGVNPKTVWYSGGRKSRAEVIEWKDVDIDDDAYTLILEAASSFSMTPSALRDTLEDHLAKGMITPQEYRYQLGASDFDMLNGLASAGYDDIMRVIDLLEDGKYEKPVHEQDLVNGVPLVQLRCLALNQYEEDDELTQVKLGFYQWLTEARAILRSGSQAQIPQQQAPGPMAAGPAVPPPQPSVAATVA
jgi:hypothetical protein